MAKFVGLITRLEYPVKPYHWNDMKQRGILRRTNLVAVIADDNKLNPTGAEKMEKVKVTRTPVQVLKWFIDRKMEEEAYQYATSLRGCDVDDGTYYLKMIFQGFLRGCFENGTNIHSFIMAFKGMHEEDKWTELFLEKITEASKEKGINHYFQHVHNGLVALRKFKLSEAEQKIATELQTLLDYLWEYRGTPKHLRASMRERIKRKLIEISAWNKWLEE